MLQRKTALPRFWEKLPVVDKAEILEEAVGSSVRPPIALRHLPPRERVRGFDVYEGTLSEAEARLEANRCLSCGGCSQCQECVAVCPAGAIDFTMRDQHLTVDVGSVIVATGFDILDPGINPLLGYGRYPNVISGMQMDRLLAPTRPYSGVLRPSDGKEPDNIAIVLCNGSRDVAIDNPLCCRVGCMYSAKHAQLLMGALPMADVTIYAIDVRAFGKGYDEFVEQSRSMGVQYVHGKVARIDEKDDGNLLVHFENLASGGTEIMEHDLVVLTVGLVPNPDALRLFQGEALAADEYSFVSEADPIAEPTATSIPGLFAAGAVSGPRDIPDTVVHAGAAAAQAAAYLERVRAT